MQINFESSGGYANLRLTYRADTQELPLEVADEISRLVQESGFFDLRESDLGPASPGIPDAISYSLSVSEGGRTKSLSVNDATAGPLHPLLARLRQLALGERQRGR